MKKLKVLWMALALVFLTACNRYTFGRFEFPVPGSDEPAVVVCVFGYCWTVE